jgi:hypothetical protein
MLPNPAFVLFALFAVASVARRRRASSGVSVLARSPLHDRIG